MLNDVTFPTLAQVSDDDHALAVGYRRTLRLAATAVFPAVVGTALVAPAFVRAVLRLEWIPAVRPLQAIALAAIAQGLTATDKSLWQAVDRPDLLTKAKSLTLAVLTVTAVPATFLYGTLGTAAAVAATAFLVAPIRAWFVAKVLDASVREVTALLVGPAIATLAMAAVVTPVVARLRYTRWPRASVLASSRTLSPSSCSTARGSARPPRSATSCGRSESEWRSMDF